MVVMLQQYVINWITTDGFIMRVLFPLNLLTLCISMVVFCLNNKAFAENENIEFNTDVLDVKDRTNIDLSRYAQAGYVTPGNYQLVLHVNKKEIAEQNVQYFAPDNEPKGSLACLTADIAKAMGLKAEAEKKISWWHDGQCINPSSLEGLTMRTDLGEGVLYISVPQAFLEYTDENWDPPSSWDDGVAGIIFDYNANAQHTHTPTDHNNDSDSVSGNGTSGVNLGPWRLRADWQATYDNGQETAEQKNWDWNRYYAYRALPKMGAKLTLGEDFLNSSLFDSFRFIGASLATDDNMLPPNLRGYAPEVSGVARTNAKVTVSQQGRVLYETQVPSGPFRIQDLNSAVSGTLDVKVQEQDGTTQNYQVDTANVPYLTRPGLVRYRLAVGKPQDYDHHSEDPGFGTGEFSWGINNGWSLYGGGLFAGDYNAASLGIGRDLLIFGALSFDITQSRADLANEGIKSGGSYRLSYSKRFEDYDSQVTFAGYRFSQKEFMSMSDYLNARYDDNNNDDGKDKELYTITLNKNFRTLGVSTYLNFSHRTYWNQSANDSWNLSLSKYMDIGKFKNISVNVSAFRNYSDSTHDDGVYLSVGIPWGDNSSLTFDGQYGSGDNSNMVGYYSRMDANNTWQVKTGTGAESRPAASGYFTHDGDRAAVTLNGSVQDAGYSSIGMNLQGGVTATTKGMALHRISKAGGTRMMVDTDHISGVPVQGNFGGLNHSNAFGKAVIGDVNDYYHSSLNVDVNQLPADVDATRSVVEGTLTEGAIGYREFGLITGQKMMAVIRQADGSYPPFGAQVMNTDNAQTGIVGDEGSVWLTGITPNGEMTVHWDGAEQCRFHFPAKITADTQNLLLPCNVLKGSHQEPSAQR